MKSLTWTLGSICYLLVVISAATSTVYAAPIKADCGKGEASTACSRASQFWEHPGSDYLRHWHVQRKHRDCWLR
jgi:hypothetical protein